jgi:leucyl aminopeptidase (aminopeptidase T)
MKSSGPFLKELGHAAATIAQTCLGVKPDEVVAVLVDTPNARVGEALALAVDEAGGLPNLMVFSSRSAHGEDPPPEVAAKLMAADAGVLAAKYSLASAPARRNATAAGVRIISIPACSEGLFSSPAMQVDFVALRPVVERLGDLLTQTKHVHISTIAGTDLSVELCERPSVDQSGFALEPGSWSPFPNIETAVGPKDDGVEGLLVVDGVLVPGGIPDEPVFCTIEQGRIVKVAGGASASQFEKRLDSFHDPNVRQIVELGFGLNPKAKIGRGLMAEDESQWGTVHLGIGEGRTFGIDNPAPTHMDLVIKEPTVSFDDRQILERGSYTLAGFDPGAIE